ncbi:MAG: hypothetical protein FIA92_06975 [Chloroflexi bacterium]|nr:hypothetical protein [Chloroflexota bacterium]
MSQPNEELVAPSPSGSTTDASAVGGAVATLEPPEPTTPAATEASPPEVPSRPSPKRDRLEILIPALLAALGLAAALIAWRASVASNAAGEASGAGLAAARQRAISSIIGEGITARTIEAYLDYERARRQAEMLASEGFDPEAQLARMEATSHWFLVRPEYLDRAGAFQPDRQRAALLAADEARVDINPDSHFEAAEIEQARIRALLMAGIVLALALPFLTLAEITRGRPRVGGTVAGAAIFSVGIVLAAAAWV